MDKRSKLEPVFWSSLIFIIAQALALYGAFREKAFVEANQITSPQISIELPLVYFFTVVVLLGVILFIVPISRLKIALKIMFTVLFSWGIFIALGLSLPTLAAAVIAVAGGSIWFFRPRIWLHNLLLLIALVSVGVVFGFLLSPWAAMSLMLVLSVYDFLAVRFGYMLWLAGKLSQSEVLPAFIIPKQISRWNLDLNKAGFKKLFEDSSSERELSILGGGDIGFPLLLVVSVFFAYGFANSLIVAAFSLLGLISAYWFQLVFLKGKPMPALPPISLVSLIGFLIVYLT
ncbi:presenilin family intramembrane aspartyl protease [Chloroflexota bacterium]